MFTEFKAAIYTLWMCFHRNRNLYHKQQEKPFIECKAQSLVTGICAHFNVLLVTN